MAPVEKWFSPTVETGWHKTIPGTHKLMPMVSRRRLALRAHKGDKLATARALQALANVTRDRETRRLARADALYFYEQHRKTGK